MLLVQRTPLLTFLHPDKPHFGHRYKIPPQLDRLVLLAFATLPLHVAIFLFFKTFKNKEKVTFFLH
jgi:hypothetical protein